MYHMTMSTMSTVQLTVRIPSELQRKIRLFCAEHDVKIQDFVRLALEVRLGVHLKDKEDT